MDRLVLFVEPRKRAELDHTGKRASAPSATYRVWCKRMDGSGTEGFVTGGLTGGRWQRTYECWAEAFPVVDGVRVRPAEGWVVQGDDGVALKVSAVDEVESGPHPVKLAVRCYRSSPGQGGVR